MVYEQMIGSQPILLKLGLWSKDNIRVDMSFTTFEIIVNELTFFRSRLLLYDSGIRRSGTGGKGNNAIVFFIFHSKYQT